MTEGERKIIPFRKKNVIAEIEKALKKLERLGSAPYALVYSESEIDGTEGKLKAIYGQARNVAKVFHERVENRTGNMVIMNTKKIPSALHNNPDNMLLGVSMMARGLHYQHIINADDVVG